MDNQQKFNFQPNGFTKQYSIDYKDPDLFGSDDAAHVEFNLLKSYSVTKNDCKEYLDEKAQLKILCAPKGTGKTTICRLWENEISTRPGFLSIFNYDSNISPDLSNASITAWIREWKKVILKSILSKVIVQNNISDLDLNEMDVLKELGLNRAIAKNSLSDVLIKLLKDIPANKDKIEKIKAEKDKKFWIFLDEIDQYFTKDEDSINKVAAMLIASRELTSLVSNLFIRTTLKPTVWSVLRGKVSSMATITELIVDLTWTTDGIRAVIAKRIESYLIRKNYINDVGQLFNDVNIEMREDGLINKVFSNNEFDLGKGNRKPHIILSSLGFYRPRWILDLCKTVSKKKGKNGQLIEFKDVHQCMASYGKERINDIRTEYEYQCSQINEIIFSFLNTKSSYTLFDLFSHINEKVLNKKIVSISGVSEECDPQQIANFLYEIGFIEPKKLLSPGKYEFLYFKDYPSLIEDEIINERVENDLFWEIHPSFRDVLHLGKLTNKEVLENTKKNGRKK